MTTEKTTHTPGPWRSSRSGSWSGYSIHTDHPDLDQPSDEIARLDMPAYMPRWSQAEANARLIAAAPALLEAAEATSDVLRELSKLVQEGLFDAAEDYADANSGLTDLHVRSAIAQATGDQP